ncbi:MAG: UDP-3-O-(3-hydroxymyristoyl)glucosamine N-acyltransferase [Candidatus Polarisedimenticolia bacterium]
MESYTLGEIATRLKGVVHGDAGVRISGIRPLDEAGPGDLSFIALPRYRRAAEASRAGALIARDAAILPGRNLIVVGNPYSALAVAMGLFFREEPSPPGISPLAVIGAGCRLGADVSVGPFVVLGRVCVLGERAALLPGVVLGDGVSIGPDSRLGPGVVVYRRSVLGARVVVHANAVIGADGFGFAEEGGERTKIPQAGNVRIGDDVEIGACATIDRATFGSTIIGRGSKIDNLVQIGHNVQVGEDAVLVAQTGIAGSTRIGRGVVFAGRAGASGHLEIGEGAVVGATSVALQDVAPGAYVLGCPAEDHRDWKRQQAALRRLPDALRRLARLEETLHASGAGAVADHPRRRSRTGRRTRRAAPARS